MFPFMDPTADKGPMVRALLRQMEGIMMFRQEAVVCLTVRLQMLLDGSSQRCWIPSVFLLVHQEVHDSAEQKVARAFSFHGLKAALLQVLEHSEPEDAVGARSPLANKFTPVTPRLDSDCGHLNRLKCSSRSAWETPAPESFAIRSPASWLNNPPTQ